MWCFARAPRASSEEIKCGHASQVGVFKAGFLVVTSLEHPYNNLGDLQRAKWSPALAAALGTLDIG